MTVLNGKANMIMHAGIIERVTDYDGYTTYDNGDGTNEEIIKAALNAYTYETVGYFKDCSIYHSNEDEKEIKTDYCGGGTIDASSTLTPRIEFVRQQVASIDLFANFLGLSVKNVAGSSQSVIDEDLGSVWIVGTPIKLANTNGDKTIIDLTGADAVQVAGVTVVRGTDYNDYVDSNGYTYIVPVTAQSGVITVDYSYTPNQSKLLSYKVEDRSLPFNIFRITECVNVNGEFDVHYLIKHKITGEIQQQFINKKTTEFEGSSMSFTVQDGGNYFRDNKKITAY